LNFSRLQEIQTTTHNIPLVLHGGTGIPTEQIKKSISLGVCKINVNTECQLSFANATRKYIEDKKDLDTHAKGFDPRKLLKPGTEAIENTCIEKFKIFGSFGKA
jgi:fructose-bisphosphate aldolase class II